MIRPLGPLHERKSHEPPKLVIRGVNRRFLTPNDFLDTIRTKVKEADPHLPTILMFPECVLRGKVVPTGQGQREAILRHEGKRMALDIHDILRAAGKPVYVAYSVTETKPSRTRSGESYPLVTNSGYLVMPEKSGNRRYGVYSKIATYEDHTNRYMNGTPLTGYDMDNISRNSNVPNTSIAAVSRLSKRIHKFPRVEIGGKIVELRICTDIGGSIEDDHPARMAGERPHLIVVPSSNLGITNYWLRGIEKLDYRLLGIQKQLGPGGSAVFLDSYNGTLMAIDKHSRRFYDVGCHRHGDLAIDHQS